MGARPATKCTPAVARRLATLIRTGVPRERAARMVGISPATLTIWLASDRAPEPSITSVDGRRRAFRRIVLDAEDQLLARAVTVVTELFDHNRPDIRLNAAKFWLTHRHGSEFSPRTETSGKIEHTGTVAVAVRPMFSGADIAAMGPDQIGAAIAALVDDARPPDVRDAAPGEE